MKNKILNNIDHKDLTIDIRPGSAYGDHINRALALSSEYSDLHKEFPILLYKDPESSEMHAHAILGFEKDENLFIEKGEWLSNYIPATMARGPFSIGYQHRGENGGDFSETVIMVDESNPRCNADVGEPVFLEQGGESPYLEHIKKVLQVIDSGVKADRLFFSLLQEMELLEEVAITITLTETSHINFKNYYTINQGRLATLSGDNLEKLNKAGALGLVFFLVSSLGNFSRMIELKNAKAAAHQQV